MSFSVPGREPHWRGAVGEGGRLDLVLTALHRALTRSQAQRAIREGRVLVDGKVERRAGRPVETGQTLELIPAEEHPAPAARFSGEVEVIYEDASLVAVNKPPGIATHPSRGHETGTLLDWYLLRYPGAPREFDSERPGLVHRLDADTSGVILLAKSREAQHGLAEQLRLRQAEKRYLALVEGVPASRQAIIEAPLGRHRADRLRMAVVARGREAWTEYEVLASAGGLALLEVRPATGRTHQIRVHLAAVGHPIVGDRVYGTPSEHIARQALHARSLLVQHPERAVMLRMWAGLPADFSGMLQRLGLEAERRQFAVSGFELV